MTTVAPPPVPDRAPDGTGPIPATPAPATTAPATPRTGVRTFVLVWVTQWLALGAMAPFGYVLGVDYATEFGTPALFVAAFLIMYLPFPLLCPLAGAIADRWGQRRALLVGNVGTLVNAAGLVALTATRSLDKWEAVAALGVTGLLKGFQLVGLESAVPLLLPKRHLARANGLRMMLTTTTAVTGSIIAGALLLAFEPPVVLALSCLPLVLAIGTLLVVRIPHAPRPAGAVERPLLAEVGQAWRFLRTRTGLMAVLGVLGAVSFLLAGLEQVIDPLVLGFGSFDDVGTVLLAGAAGLLLGTVVATVSGRPRRLVPGMLAGTLAFAAGLVLSGLRPSVTLVSVAAFVTLAGTPVLMGAIQTALHTKVEPHLMGRVMGLKNALIAGVHMSGNLVVIVLGENVLESWTPPAALAAVVGSGTGRSFAVLVIAMGLVAAAAAGVASRHTGLRRMQNALPDVTPEDLAVARVTAVPR